MLGIENYQYHLCLEQATMSETLKEKGNESFKNKEFKKAAKLYRDAIALDPKNPVLYSNRSMCFVKLNDWSRVLDDTEKGIKLCEENTSLSNDIKTKTLVKLIYRKGLAMINLKEDITQAKATFERGLKLDPNNFLIKKELEKIGIKELEKPVENKKSLENKPTIQKIEIEQVDQIPKEYKQLIKGHEDTKLKDINLNSQNDHIFGFTSGENGDNTEKRFEVQAKNNLKVQEIKSAKNIASNEGLAVDDNIVIQFPAQPSHYYLTTLTKYTGCQKIQAYKYVLSILPQTYKLLFGIAGIETDFLEFFLDAALYVLSQVNDDSGVKIKNILAVLPELKRFTLSKAFCDEQKIKDVIKSLRDKGIEDDNVYARWL